MVALALAFVVVAGVSLGLAATHGSASLLFVGICEAVVALVILLAGPLV